MNLPVLYDSATERSSIWQEEIFLGISKEALARKYNLVSLDASSYQTADYDELFEDGPRLVIVFSEETPWILCALRFFESKDIRVILVGPCVNGFPCVQANIDIDYRTDMEAAVELLHRCGCTRPAIYGVFPNSGSDNIKKSSFMSVVREHWGMLPERLCFENRTGLTDCYREFRQNRADYDALICVNGFAAASLMHHLAADGIRVPDELQVIAFGGVQLSALTLPALTVLKSNSAAVGQNAVRAYRYLRNADSEQLRLTAQVASHMIIRDSTRLLEQPVIEEARAEPTAVPAHNFYDDEEVRLFDALEKLIDKSDSLDMKVIRHLNAGHSYEKASRYLHLTKNAVFYRVKRMQELVGAESVESFRAFVMKYQDYFERAVFYSAEAEHLEQN